MFQECQKKTTFIRIENQIAASQGNILAVEIIQADEEEKQLAEERRDIVNQNITLHWSKE